MSWVATIVDPNDNKVKIDWFSLEKIVLDIVREDQFLYIYFLKLITSTALIATIFLSQFSDLFLSGPPFYFIPSFPFHLYPSRVD